MVLPTDRRTTARGTRASPRRIDGSGRDDYELYEKDGEYVLSIELPGYDREEITVTWDEGRLGVVADHDADRENRRRSYRQTFRMPKAIDDEDVRARYQNGILDIYLPTSTQRSLSGKSIPVSGPEDAES